MIKFERFTLDNGLRVIVHQDKATPMACVDVLYDVGARDEDEERTGFAHLFEHLMFGGSVNIPNYDEPLQLVGGENNAFTTNDITNYYITLPASNIETAFWLESDRMLSLAFSEKSLEVQRDVVIEEFKQRYLNQPYGDVWLMMRPLAYKVHPYKWDTIGKEIAHIENAKIEDVKDFFKRFYAPNNAILVVAGDVELEQVKALAEKYFAPIPKGIDNKRNLPKEPKQTEARTLTVEKNVPLNVIYKAFHTCNRNDKNYYSTDLISDILSQGFSARFYKTLVKEKKLFSDIHSYLTGDMDEGLFFISGKLSTGVSMEDADAAIYKELERLQNEKVTDDELQKVKNKSEATHKFGEVDILNRTTNLAIAELMGNAELINQETEKYLAVTAEEILENAKQLFRKENSNTIYYKSKN
jgi:predicted Zn-dependent peptidase